MVILIPIRRLQPRQRVDDALAARLVPSILPVLLPLPAELHLDRAVQVHQPVDVALRLVVPVLDQHARVLVFTSVQALPGELDRGAGFAAAEGGEVLEEIADLGVEVGGEDGEGVELRVELLEGRDALAEEVFEEVRGNLRVEPDHHELAVVDQVDAAFFDAAVGGADGGGDDELGGFGVGEAVFWCQVVEGIDAWVEV